MPSDIKQDEKVVPTFEHVEKVGSIRSGEDTEQSPVLSPDDFTPEEEKALLKRIDLAILPLVTGEISNGDSSRIMALAYCTGFL